MLKRSILFITLSTITFYGYAQGPNPSVVNNTFTNPIILSHYSLAELQALSAKKIASINYYYTESFILDSIACNECRPFEPEKFDVSQFEQFRQQSTRYIRDYTKYGYRLTLLSRDEMKYPPLR
ncbi:MAG: hypothetical protein K0Q95_893 [Bacteroidota bacterium]|jgi:hypothetical protein|nr:hypothetical protein [Bacteroidota bacterium]